jgi:hypothetical protein
MDGVLDGCVDRVEVLPQDGGVWHIVCLHMKPAVQSSPFPAYFCRRQGDTYELVFIDGKRELVVQDGFGNWEVADVARIRYERVGRHSKLLFHPVKGKWLLRRHCWNQVTMRLETDALSSHATRDAGARAQDTFEAGEPARIKAWCDERLASAVEANRKMNGRTA